MGNSSDISGDSEKLAREIGRIVDVLSQLRRGAEGMHKLSAGVIQQLDVVRAKVEKLSTVAAAPKELKDQISVLESERDLLARQLGKVRREAEDELSVARERIRDLEVELSLATGKPAKPTGPSTAGEDKRPPPRASAPPPAEIFEIEDDAPTEKRPSFAPDDDIDATTGRMSADLVDSLLHAREDELPTSSSQGAKTEEGIGGDDIRGSSVGGVLEDLLSTYLDEK